MAYLGASPFNVFSAPTKDVFSGDGSTAVFTLSKSAGSAATIDVFVANVRQEPDVAYTTSDRTLTFTSAPASGSSNIYVINNSTVIGNGLLPVPGRDSDSVTNFTSSGTITAAAITASSTATISGALTTSSTATIGGDTKISGNLRSDTSADGIQINATDGSAGNAGDLVLLDGTDGSATNAGSSLLYEDGTGDPASYYNNDLVAFSSDVKIGDEVTANSITVPSIRKNISSPSFVLPSADGTSGQAIITDASGNLSFGDAGGGKILQVVSTTKTDTFSTTANSFTLVTGLTADITPSATSSKIYISVTLMGQRATADTDYGLATLFKDGSNHLTSLLTGSPGSRVGAFSTGGQPDSVNKAIECYTLNMVDSPSSTSSITYDVRVQGYSGTFYVNRCENPDNDSLTPRGISTITLMEIDGS